MAIEFLRASMLTRGKNLRGVPAHMAYRSCTKIYDQKADRTFDYTQKNSVLDDFLINAGGNTLEELANKMEAAENRKDAQVAREFVLALPHELSLKANQEICKSFVNLMVEKFGIAAHVAIHKPDDLRNYETHRKEDSLKNVHAHITVSTRAIDSEGNFSGKKLREMNDRKYLESLKMQTRNIINKVLVREGFSPMEIRDSNKIGTKHLGPELTRMERRGISTEKGERNRVVEKMNNLTTRIKKIDEEIEVLREGNITIDGLTYKHVPYPKGRDFKPYVLASKSIKELFREMRIGKLRVKERYDNEMIRSFSYKGQGITVAELALINPTFPNKELFQIEQKLLGGFKKVKLNKRSKKSEKGNAKAYEGIRRIKTRRKNFVPSMNTDYNLKEAHWHAQQAAFAIENNKPDQ